VRRRPLIRGVVDLLLDLGIKRFVPDAERTRWSRRKLTKRLLRSTDHANQQGKDERQHERSPVKTPADPAVVDVRHALYVTRNQLDLGGRASGTTQA